MEDTIRAQLHFFYVGYVMLKYAKKVPCRSKVPFWYSKIAERCDDAYE